MSVLAIGVGLGGAALSAGIAAISTNKQTKAAAAQADDARGVVEAQAERVKGVEFNNVYEGIGDKLSTYDPSTVDAAQTGYQGYDAGQAKLGNLGSAQGYSGAQSESAQLGSAGQASLRNLAGGADFLSNPFSNLQVGTAAADRENAASDQALASQQASGLITGAGGATALAQAAASSKQGVSANIQQQELQNANLRAQGKQTLEQGLLSQSNQGQQFGAQQDQFNVGARNQFAQAQAGFDQQTNLANQQSTNQASQFTAGAQNDFSKTNFAAQNQLSQFNTSAQNRASEFTAGAANAASSQNASLSQQANLANQGAYNQADQFGAGVANQGTLLEAEGSDVQQQREYAREVDLLNAYGGQAASASTASANAQASRTQAISGGIQAGISAGTQIGVAKIGQ